MFHLISIIYIYIYIYIYIFLCFLCLLFVLYVFVVWSITCETSGESFKIPKCLALLIDILEMKLISFSIPPYSKPYIHN